MSSTSTVRRAARTRPSEVQQAGAERHGRQGRLGRLQSLLSRPLGLERRKGQLHVVLVDVRKPSPSDPAVVLEMLRKELRDRLLAHQDAHAAQVMRHLVFVHHELGRKGWAGVGSFPSRVLRKALTQAEMLACEESSPMLSMAIDRLRACRVAAELREERASHGPDSAHFAGNSSTEVSEATHEEFAAMERGWVDTVSSVLTMAPMAR